MAWAKKILLGTAWLAMAVAVGGADLPCAHRDASGTCDKDATTANPANPPATVSTQASTASSPGTTHHPAHQACDPDTTCDSTHPHHPYPLKQATGPILVGAPTTVVIEQVPVADTPPKEYACRPRTATPWPAEDQDPNTLPDTAYDDLPDCPLPAPKSPEQSLVSDNPQTMRSDRQRFGL